MPFYNYLAFLFDLFLNYMQCNRLQAFITFFQVILADFRYILHMNIAANNTELRSTPTCLACRRTREEASFIPIP